MDSHGCEDWISSVSLQQMARGRMQTILLCYMLTFLLPNFFNLRMESEKLKLSGWKVTGARVVKARNGNSKYGSALIKQTAQNAMRLLKLVIDIIKEIPFHEKWELCLTQEKFSIVGAKAPEQLKKLVYCPPCYVFFHMSSLRAANLFMIATFGGNDTAQVDNIFIGVLNFWKVITSHPGSTSLFL